jgi:acyl dehydratase
LAASEPQLFFDDFEPGQIYKGERRLLDDATFRLFADLTGDAHPIHYDEEYAAATQFGARLAHGLLLVSMTALGAMPLSARLRDAMIAFGRVEAKFIKPVLIGTSVQNALEVIECRKLDEDKGWVVFKATLIDDSGDTVLAGRHEYLLKASPKGAV